MESSVYGFIDTGVVEVDYDPYDDWSYDSVQRVDELPDLVDNVIFRVSKNAIDLNQLSNEFEHTETSKMRDFFARGLRDDPKVSLDSSYANVVEIDPIEVKRFNKELDKVSNENVDFFKQFLQSFLSHDRATASIEAFVRDGLDLGQFTVDPTLSTHVKNILYMSYVNRVLKKSHLPKEVVVSYLDALRASMFDDLKNKTKSKEFQSMINRYRDELNNPVGMDKHSIGSIKHGRAYGSRQKDK